MSNRLLVIDDSTIHRTILLRAGEKAGYVAVGAASVSEAVGLLQSEAFDCITLDLSLGDEDGSDVLRALSAANCKTPIIVISGAETTVAEETVKFGKSLGLNLSPPVGKPVDLSALKESLTGIGRTASRQKLSAARTVTA